MTSLVDVRRKIDWARKHLARFEDSLADFKHHSPFTLQQTGIERTPDGHARLNFKLTCNEAPPDWSLHVGDCVHNLRSALDHLICQLARKANNPTACDQAQFPIFVNNDATCRRTMTTLLKVLPGGADVELMNAQPFSRRPSDPAGDTLYLLSKLDNVDKHRFLVAVDPKLDDTFVTLTVNGVAGPRAKVSEFIPGWTPLKQDVLYLRLTSKGAPPKDSNVHLDVDASTGIVFANTGLRCDGSEVSAVLDPAFADVIAIVDKFEQMFFR